VDPSALIFVALAVAWAVYLVPKALEHHDESLRRRTVSTVSHTMRVLARRDKLLGLTAQRPAKQRPAGPGPAMPAGPVATPGQEYVEVPVELSPAERRARRAAAKRATRRRQRVLAVIMLALVTVTVLAATAVVAWPWVAAPGGVLIAWLVACRLMVRKERAVRMVRVPAAAPQAEPAAYAEDEVADGAAPVTTSRVMVFDDAGNPTGQYLTVEDTSAGRWDPVSVPLPTYVNKPAAARRSVRTIDLDGTGVWSSGRNDADSAIAREAEEAAQAARDARAAERHRATGS